MAGRFDWVTCLCLLFKGSGLKATIGCLSISTSTGTISDLMPHHPICSMHQVLAHSRPMSRCPSSNSKTKLISRRSQIRHLHQTPRAAKMISCLKNFVPRSSFRIHLAPSLQRPMKRIALGQAILFVRTSQSLDLPHTLAPFGREGSHRRFTPGGQRRRCQSRIPIALWPGGSLMLSIFIRD